MIRPALLVTLPVLAALCALPGCKPAPASAEAAAPSERSPVQAKPESRIRVEIARLEPSDASLAFTFPGEVEGSRDAVLAAALGGLVEAVLVEEGDRVKKGQPLLRVDTAIHGARRDQAQADYDQAKADFERTEAMGEAVSKAQQDAARTRLRVAEAGLRLAEAQLTRSIVRAPFDGVVAQLTPDVGEVAAPSSPVARVVQLSPVKVSISVADRDITALEPGMKVRVTTDASAEVHEGTITFVSPAGNLRTRAFTVEVAVPNEDKRLLPGMIARVHVDAAAAKEALVVPQDVLVTKRDDIGVFVDDAGRARWQPLKVGQIVGSQVVVTEGVARGDRVVVTGHRELVEGDALDIAREGVCCARGRVKFEAAQSSEAQR